MGYGYNSDEIQLRIDPIHSDFDDEVTGLWKQVRRLRDVSEFVAFLYFQFVFLETVKEEGDVVCFLNMYDDFSHDVIRHG